MGCHHHCLALKKLFVLIMGVFPSTLAPHDPISPESSLVNAQLPQLRKISFTGNLGIVREDFTDNLQAWVNAERHEKGRASFGT